MVYNCIIKKSGSLYWVLFPDMTNIQTFGNTREEALAMAKEALDGCLESDICHNNSIPAPVFKKGIPVTVSNNIVFALRLRQLRGKQSQTDIAGKLGMSYQAYQRLENPRKTNPTIKTLEKIAQVYGRELSIVF